MSDARWTEVAADVRSATRHFSKAMDIHGKLGGAAAGADEEYIMSMAFMHAMQAGHTSFEQAMLRILDMLEEERPTGNAWHRDLIRRVSGACGGRPPVLDEELAKAADGTRAFRNVASRAYDTFSLEQCEPALAAAHIMKNRLDGAVLAFMQAVDPPVSSGEAAEGPP